MRQGVMYIVGREPAVAAGRQAEPANRLAEGRRAALEEHVGIPVLNNSLASGVRAE